MANNGGWDWSYNSTITTGTSMSTTSTGYYINIPVTTAQPLTLVQPMPSAGHVPAYSPPSLAEDELAWLRRRITEVTDLFPVAA